MRALSSLLILLPFTACGAPSQPVVPPSPAVSAVEPAPAPPSAAALPRAAATSAAAAPVASAAPTAEAPAHSSVAPAAPAPRCPEGMTFVAGGDFTPPWNPKGVAVADLCVDTTETTAKAYAECASAGACTTKQVDCAAQSTFGKNATED